MSKLLSLNYKDVLKGIVTAIISSVVVFLYQRVNAGNLTFTEEDLKQLLVVAMSAGLGYIIKNYFTSEDGKLFGRI